MPDDFDQKEFRRKLIAGGLSPEDARALTSRTAAGRRGAAKTGGDRRRQSGRKLAEVDPPVAVAELTTDLFRPAPSADFPAPPPATVIQSAAQDIRKLARQGKNTPSARGRPATDTPVNAVEDAPDTALLKCATDQLKSLQLTLFDIAPWPDHMRGMPNDFGRTALFTARNKRTPRAELKDEVIFSVMKDVKITYTGTELRNYDDELIWLQVLEYAKRVPAGAPFTFTLYRLCQDLDWPINKQYYERIEESLTRLQTTALKFSSKRVGRLESLSLIRKFGFLNRTDKRKSLCQVFLEEEIVLLFAGEHYAKFVWEKYRKLSGIARRMFDYFSTHREPYPLSLDNFRLLCRSDTSTLKKWRELTIAAGNELGDSRLVKSISVKDNLIHCDR